MGRQSCIPTLYDDVLQLKMHRLKEWGYIREGNHQHAKVHWLVNGIEVASISIEVRMYSLSPYIMLDYKYRGLEKRYRVNLTFQNSNLNGSKIWYFVCPKTGKRCRKLYCVDGYFFHRDAFSDSLYISQTLSKKARDLNKILGQAFGLDSLYSELLKKNLKKKYRGKPTKKLSALTKKIEIGESISYQNLEWAMIK